MFLAAIVLVSLILQCTAAYHSFRLISLTGHARAWLLLSAGIATMAVRRFIALETILSTSAAHGGTDYAMELIGLAGSLVMVVGVVSIRPFFLQVRKSEEEQRSLALSLQGALDHVKRLKEILPICASCKKIRDDDGYWQHVDMYLASHSDTQVSHGLCADCVRKLYPDLGG